MLRTRDLAWVSSASLGALPGDLTTDVALAAAGSVPKKMGGCKNGSHIGSQ